MQVYATCTVEILPDFSFTGLKNTHSGGSILEGAVWLAYKTI